MDDYSEREDKNDKRQNGGGARAKRRGEKKIPEETGLTPPLEWASEQNANHDQPRDPNPMTRAHVENAVGIGWHGGSRAQLLTGTVAWPNTTTPLAAR